MISRKVSSMQMTKALFVPNYGTFSRSTFTHKDFVMTISEVGVFCSTERHEFIVPWHMIEVAVLLREESSDAKESSQAA